MCDVCISDLRSRDGVRLLIFFFFQYSRISFIQAKGDPAIHLRLLNEKCPTPSGTSFANYYHDQVASGCRQILDPRTFLSRPRT